MPTLITLECSRCGTTFLRPASEVRRSKRLGRRVFCNLSCSGKSQPPHGGDATHLIANNRLDNYSPFRQHFRLAKRHAKNRKREFTITLQDLKAQWEKQNGRCPYTGWELATPPTTDWRDYPSRPERASIDRIDSSKGYTPDNIQWICVIANYAKHEFTTDELIHFCQAVANQVEVGGVAPPSSDSPI